MKLVLGVFIALAMFSGFYYYGDESVNAMPINIAPVQYNTVNKNDFWIWGGIRTRPLLSSARRLYVLQGEVLSQKNQVVFERRGGSPVAIKAELFLVFRFEQIPQTILGINKDIKQAILRRVAVWEKKGNKVLGVQLDFDSPTAQLDYYATFLQSFRLWLPERYQLSVTGLLDWVNTPNPNTLKKLTEPVDEIVFQTHQHKSTIKAYQAYLTPILKKIKSPFKVGVVEGGEWDSRYEQRLNTSEFYQGKVIFLVNSE